MIPYRFQMWSCVENYMTEASRRESRTPYSNYQRMLASGIPWLYAIEPIEFGRGTRQIAYWTEKADDPDKDEFFIQPQAAIAQAISLRAIAARINREKRQMKGKHP